MRVPHESEAGFVGWRVSNGAGWRSCSGRANRAYRGFGAQVGTAAKPGTVGEDIGIWQSGRTAAGNVAYRGGLQRFVVVLAPLEVVDRCRSAGVVAVTIGVAGESGSGS